MFQTIELMFKSSEFKFKASELMYCDVKHNFPLEIERFVINEKKYFSQNTI